MADDIDFDFDTAFDEAGFDVGRVAGKVAKDTVAPRKILPSDEKRPYDFSFGASVAKAVADEPVVKGAIQKGKELLHSVSTTHQEWLKPKEKPTDPMSGMFNFGTDMYDDLAFSPKGKETGNVLLNNLRFKSSPKVVNDVVTPPKAVPVGVDMEQSTYSAIQEEIKNIKVYYNDPSLTYVERPSGYNNSGFLMSMIGLDDYDRGAGATTKGANYSMTPTKNTNSSAVGKELASVKEEELKVGVILNSTTDWRIAESLNANPFQYLAQVENKFGYITKDMAKQYHMPDKLYSAYLQADPSSLKHIDVETLREANHFTTVDEGLAKGHKTIPAIYKVATDGTTTLTDSEKAEYAKIDTFGKAVVAGLTPRQAIDKLRRDRHPITEEQVDSYMKKLKGSAYEVLDRDALKQVLQDNAKYDREISEEEAKELGISEQYRRVFNEDVFQKNNHSPTGYAFHKLKNVLSYIGDSVETLFADEKGVGNLRNISLVDTALTVTGIVDTLRDDFLSPNEGESESATTKLRNSTTPNKRRRLVKIPFSSYALDKAYNYMSLTLPAVDDPKLWSMGDKTKFIKDYTMKGGHGKIDFNTLQKMGVPFSVLRYLHTNDMIDTSEGGIPTVMFLPMDMEDLMLGGAILGVTEKIGKKVARKFTTPNQIDMAISIADSTRKGLLATQAVERKAGNTVAGEVTPATHRNADLEELEQMLVNYKTLDSIGGHDDMIEIVSGSLRTVNNIFTQQARVLTEPKVLSILDDYGKRVLKAGNNAKDSAKVVTETLTKLRGIEKSRMNTDWDTLSKSLGNKPLDIKDLTEDLLNWVSKRPIKEGTVFANAVSGLTVNQQVHKTVYNQVMNTVLYRQASAPPAEKRVIKSYNKLQNRLNSYKTHNRGFEDSVISRHTFSVLKDEITASGAGSASFQSAVREVEGIIGHPLSQATINNVQNKLSRSINAYRSDFMDLAKMTNQNLIRLTTGSSPNIAKLLHYTILSNHSGVDTGMMRAYVKNNLRLARGERAIQPIKAKYDTIMRTYSTAKPADLIDMVKNINRQIHNPALFSDDPLRKAHLITVKTAISKYLRGRIDDPAVIAKLDRANNSSARYYKNWGNDPTKGSKEVTHKALTDMVATEGNLKLKDSEAILTTLGKSGANTEGSINMLRRIKLNNPADKAIRDDSIKRLQDNYVEKMIGKESADALSDGFLGIAQPQILSSKINRLIATKGDEAHLVAILGKAKVREIKGLKFAADTMVAFRKTTERDLLRDGALDYIVNGGGKGSQGFVARHSGRAGRTLRLAIDLIGHTRNKIVENTPVIGKIVTGLSGSRDIGVLGVNPLYSGIKNNKRLMGSVMSNIRDRITSKRHGEQVWSVVQNIGKSRRKYKKVEQEIVKAGETRVAHQHSIARINEQIATRTRKVGEVDEVLNYMHTNGIGSDSQALSHIDSQMMALQHSPLLANDPALYTTRMQRLQKLKNTISEVRGSSPSGERTLEVFKRENNTLINDHRARIAEHTRGVTSERDRVLNLNKRLDALRNSSKFMSPTERLKQLMRIKEKRGLNKRQYVEYAKEWLRSIPNKRLRQLNRRRMELDKQLDYILNTNKHIRETTMTGHTIKTATESKFYDDILFYTSLGGIGYSYGKYLYLQEEKHRDSFDKAVKQGRQTLPQAYTEANEKTMPVRTDTNTISEAVDTVGRDIKNAIGGLF